MQNKNSTSGFLEDLIRGFVQLCALELHAKTSVEKADNKVKTVEAEEITNANDELESAIQHLSKITRQRRSAMVIISNYAEKLNMDKWCEVKHAAMSMITFFEVFQANPDDYELFDLYVTSNNLFIEIVADFIGLKIEPCAACFSDALKNMTDEDSTENEVAEP